ncbi:hypothetical protein C1Y40_04688 [Mycobacterium talmoniae]|uniref:DUF4304 domain-containing protein n=1 Tax=Mycobacterium talmoniae TaxID=1858794 RepID=A0A2S8BEN5_9MYCO|nr:DUF4304 domain-containing protein [Mycobacterium eburneum]PQM45147.1 hypothetical protein C1Y40_04688 [Mycobacterium talmoniae]
MSEYLSRTGVLRQTLEQLLSTHVRSFLKPRGFTKSGRTFRRARGPLYDLINFQGSKWNGVTPQHSFFVNVGVGSTDMDAVYLEWPDSRKPPREYVLDRRWERLVPQLPSEVGFDETTDLELFADLLIDGLARVLTCIDAIDTTRALAQWAIDHNLLHHMEKTCSYLASTNDLESLATYVTALRDRFSDDIRWQSFNRKLIEVAGPWASILIGRGLLDPDQISVRE